MNVQTMPIIEVANTLEACQSVSGNVSVPRIRVPVYESCRWPYILTMPLSWLLTVYVMAKKRIFKMLGMSEPRINTIWFDGLGVSPRKVKDGATSWMALDEIYNYNFGRSFRLGVVIDDFWEGMLNCQAVRNRFKLVGQEVRRAIRKFEGSEEIRLMSLACGSAQAVIEIVSEFKSTGTTVRVLLVDTNQVALDYAHSLAKRYGVTDRIIVKKASVAQVGRLSRDFKPHIVEMLGFLDYIEQDKAIRLARKIQESLPSKGVFLTCNIAPNMEKHFLKWVVNWSMIYRNPYELAEIASVAGFEDYRLIYEPLRIHGVLVAEKA